MKLLTPLLKLAGELTPAKLDVFQYLNKSPRSQSIPFNIRVFLRRRHASLLGKAIHNQHTLAIALATTGSAIVDSRFIRLSPGHALLIFPHQIHEYMDIEEREVLWLFCGFMLEDNAPYQPLRCAPVPLCTQSARDIEAIMKLALLPQENAALDNATRGVRLALRVKLLIEQLLDNRWRELSASGKKCDQTKIPDDDNPLVAHTCQYISTHLQDAINIEDIANSLHVSPGHLRNEFRLRTGCSLGRYIRYIKMHNACSLMNTSDLSLAEVGEKCGYTSIYAFSRAFKRDKGLSPSEYRLRRPKED